MQKDITEADDHCKRLQKVGAYTPYTGSTAPSDCTHTLLLLLNNVDVNTSAGLVQCDMHYVRKVDMHCLPFRSFLGLPPRRSFLARRARTMTLRLRMCKQPLRSMKLPTSPCSAWPTKSTARCAMLGSVYPPTPLALALAVAGQLNAACWTMVQYTNTGFTLNHAQGWHSLHWLSTLPADRPCNTSHRFAPSCGLILML